MAGTTLTPLSSTANLSSTTLTPYDEYEDDDYAYDYDDNATNASAAAPADALGPSEVFWSTFMIEGVLLVVISVVGIVGNVFSVMGLAR